MLVATTGSESAVEVGEWEVGRSTRARTVGRQPNHLSVARGGYGSLGLFSSGGLTIVCAMRENRGLTVARPVVRQRAVVDGPARFSHVA